MSLTIEINGKKYDAEQGETILTVLNRNGIKVPTLCHMKDFVPSGACRMCVVELEGSGKLVTSCSFPVADGMKILTHSSRVVESRKTIVELLLSNHPDDCLYCIATVIVNYKAYLKNTVVGRRIWSENKHRMDHSSLSITRDRKMYSLWPLCTRACEETMEFHVLITSIAAKLLLVHQ